MNAIFKSIPHHDAFEALRNGHGVILTTNETAGLAVALQGIHAITAVLQQRELDDGQDHGEGLTFDSRVALGLISALATCAKFANDIVDTGGLMGQCAEHGSPAYAELNAARFRVMEANRHDVGTSASGGA